MVTPIRVARKSGESDGVDEGAPHALQALFTLVGLTVCAIAVRSEAHTSDTEAH